MLLSIVVPAYNEEDVLPEFHLRLSAVLEQLDCQSRILYVNDGSGDSTAAIIKGLLTADDRVALIDLSRNFGKEIAMTAGFDHAEGDAVVVIDADLQDPPELIPELVKHFREGYDVVYAQRMSRAGERALKKSSAFLFYRLIQASTRVHIPADTGDFRLLSRRALDALNKLREQHRFMKGLYAWIGFPQKAVPYHRDPRKAGQTKWNYWKLWNFALEGFTSFTIGPLKVATYLGITTAFAAFVYALWVIYKTLAHGDPVAGYPSLMVVILFLGGIQLMTIGVLGEYLGRMFDETKQRPLYFVKEYRRASAAGNHTAEAPRAQSTGRA
jgi:polyisoprenyl-phosphate glycosyltransferase